MQLTIRPDDEHQLARVRLHRRLDEHHNLRHTANIQRYTMVAQRHIQRHTMVTQRNIQRHTMVTQRYTQRHTMVILCYTQRHMFTHSTTLWLETVLHDSCKQRYTMVMRSTTR